MHFPPETSNIQLLVRLLVKLHLDKDQSLAKRIAEVSSLKLIYIEAITSKVYLYSLNYLSFSFVKVLEAKMRNLCTKYLETSMRCKSLLC